MTDLRHSDLYPENFFENLIPGSMRSAATVIPLLASALVPKSVVDVGCGPGTWTAAFRDAGVADYLGVDGEFIANLMQIDRDHFLAHDLKRPLQLDRRFDLAISMEVAEHLPPEAADDFVASLAALSDNVLFSAARPGQGGQHHLNEQPPRYWAEKFAALGYATFDLLRPGLWGRDEVEWWYRQNVLFFSKSPALMRDVRIAASRRDPADPLLDVVHPEGFNFRLGVLTDRIEKLHETYKKRIRDAKAEVWAKKAQTSDDTYSAVWDRYQEEVFPGIKSRRNARAQQRNEPLIAWGGEEWGFEPAVADIIDKTFPHYPAGTKLKLVEIGGGAGRFTVPILRRYPGAELLAFDVSPVYLGALGERLKAEGLLERANLHRLDDDPDTMGRAIASKGLVGNVDIVFSYDAMVHVDLPTLMVYFMTAGMTLKPGGSIVMSVADPTTDEGGAQLRRSCRRIYSEMGRPSVKFIYSSRESIRAALDGIGFETTFLSGNGRDLYFSSKLADKARACAAAREAGFPDLTAAIKA